jgi:hypothetical protein
VIPGLVITEIHAQVHPTLSQSVGQLALSQGSKTFAQIHTAVDVIISQSATSSNAAPASAPRGNFYGEIPFLLKPLSSKHRVPNAVAFGTCFAPTLQTGVLEGKAIVYFSEVLGIHPYQLAYRTAYDYTPYLSALLWVGRGLSSWSMPCPSEPTPPLMFPRQLEQPT